MRTWPIGGDYLYRMAAANGGTKRAKSRASAALGSSKFTPPPAGRGRAGRGAPASWCKSAKPRIFVKALNSLEYYSGQTRRPFRSQGTRRLRQNE
jgi:hypothetical protein